MPEHPPTAILVHGFLDSGEVWRPVINILGTPAAGWITPDLPGMGELTKTEGPLTLRGYADLVAASIDRVGGRSRSWATVWAHRLSSSQRCAGLKASSGSFCFRLCRLPVRMPRIRLPARSPQRAEMSTRSVRRAGV